MLTQVAPLSGSILLLVVLLSVLRNFQKLNPLSPLYLPVLIILLTNATGMVAFGFTSAYQGAFYDLGIPREALAQTLVVIVCLLAAYLAGVLLGEIFSNQVRPVLWRGDPISKTPPSTARLMPYLLCAVALVPAVIILLIFGPSEFSSRSSYVPEVNRELYITATLLFPFSGLILGFAIARSPSLLAKIFVAVSCICVLATLISMATRIVAIVPLLGAVGYVLTAQNRSRLGTAAVLICAVAISLLFLPVSLVMRSAESKGLFAALNFFWNNSPSALDEWEGAFLDVIYNIGFSLPLTALVRSSGGVTADQILISISPYPGRIAGWEDISDRLRVSYFVPYNGIGELLSYSTTAAFAYFGVAGILNSLAYRRLRHLSSGYILRLVYIAIIAADCLYLVQYNLRSATRLMWYLLALFVLEFCGRRFLTLFRSNRRGLPPTF